MLRSKLLVLAVVLASSAACHRKPAEDGPGALRIPCDPERVAARMMNAPPMGSAEGSGLGGCGIFSSVAAARQDTTFGEKGAAESSSEREASVPPAPDEAGAWKGEPRGI